MKPTRQEVKSNLYDHSEVKVRLLGEYLDRYLGIISNDGYTKRIHLYDLFCGEGVYENLGEGSPIVCLRRINELHTSVRTRQIPPIDCYFNDIEGHKVTKLKDYITSKTLHSDTFGQLRFSSDDYQKKIKEVQTKIQSLKNEKAFVFIDPYGYKHIRASDIKDLIKNGKAEVLLFLPTQFMYRFDTNGTPESLKDFINELVDIKNWRESGHVWDFINQLTEGFRNCIGQNHFVDTFTIKKDSNTVFCLFFFCSHIKGFEKMLEAKWEIDTEEGKGWEYNDYGNSLFAAIKTNPLEEKLKSYISTGSKSNSELYEYTLHCGFLPKHANDVLRNWQNNNLISITDKQGNKTRKGAFYLTYQCYKDEPQKAIYKF